MDDQGKAGKGQLVFSERSFIETRIAQRDTISAIARGLGRSPSTVEREIKRNGTAEPGRMLAVQGRNICIHQSTCGVRDLCAKGCLVPCHRCKDALCNSLCPDFRARSCPQLSKPPYCCNTCVERYGYGCEYPYHFYDAAIAQEKAASRKVESRIGLDCEPEELERTLEIAAAGLAKGQSIRHIWAANEGEMCCGWRRMYDYVALGIAGEIGPMHLPRQVRYKKRRKKADGPGVPRRNLEGRAYKDFEALSEQERMSAVEMDCVVGRQGVDGQVILTLIFRRINYQLYILLEEHTSECVVAALDMLQTLCGEAYGSLFGLILTDRGSEFADTERIEHGPNGVKRGRVFYCDAQHSEQKAKGERNHSELRRILPKGKTDFNALTRADMATLMSHVNSYKRSVLAWASPVDLAMAMLPEELVSGLGVERIEPNGVLLKPALIPHAMT